MRAEKVTEILLREQLGLTAYVFTVTRNYHLAEDVFQEICVKAIGRADEFENESHVLNWYRRSARNRAVDIIRQRDGRYLGLTEEALAKLEESWTDSTESRRSDVLTALTNCIEKLTPNNREIIRLRYFENQPSRSISEILGRKVETVYQAISRIHKALGSCIQKRMEANPH